MSKITVTTIAGQTSGSDANKVKIESGDTLQVESNATVGGTLGVTGASTLTGNVGVNGGTGGQVAVNYSTASTTGLKLNDTNSGNLGGFIDFRSGSGAGTQRATIQNANNAGIHVNVGTGGSLSFGTGYTAANALDDYEEGSWTPVCGTPGVSGSYSVQLGRYIKVGQFCHLIFNLTINSAYTGSTSSSFTIGGLPFATKAYDASLYAGGHIGYYFNVDHTNNNQTLVYQIPSGSSLTMELKGVGDAIGEQIVTPAMMGTNAVIRGSISYHTV